MVGEHDAASGAAGERAPLGQLAAQAFDLVEDLLTMTIARRGGRIGHRRFFLAGGSTIPNASNSDIRVCALPVIGAVSQTTPHWCRNSISLASYPSSARM